MALNVLLSCAGRRSYLVRYFREALGGRGRVVATNSVADTPAMVAADEAVVVPPISSPAYVSRVLEVCAEREVGLLCSLFDLDLAALAPHREQFEAAGTRTALSAPEVVDTCFDKWKTWQFGRAAGLDVPQSYLAAEAALDAVSAGEVSFPLVVKPRWGAGSIGIRMAYDADDLAATLSQVQRIARDSYLPSGAGEASRSDIVIQELVRGTEYGVDVVNDLDGAFAACFVKEKRSMRAGETDAAVTVADAEIEAMGARIARQLGHVGLLDADIIRADDRVVLLEMNPRFGGHYPFAHLAGADIPSALVAWAQGERVDPASLRMQAGVEGYKDIVPARVPHRG